MTDENALMSDINDALIANGTIDACKACAAIRQARKDMSPYVTEALESAISGSIGATKLSKILAANGLPASERHILRHRREGHTP